MKLEDRARRAATAVRDQLHVVEIPDPVAIVRRVHRRRRASQLVVVAAVVVALGLGATMLANQHHTSERSALRLVTRGRSRLGGCIALRREGRLGAAGGYPWLVCPQSKTSM